MNQGAFQTMVTRKWAPYVIAPCLGASVQSVEVLSIQL